MSDRIPEAVVVTGADFCGALRELEEACARVRELVACYSLGETDEEEVATALDRMTDADGVSRVAAMLYHRAVLAHGILQALADPDLDGKS